MPLRILIVLIGGVILAAALTVALLTSAVPPGMVGLALPTALFAVILARYGLSRL